MNPINDIEDQPVPEPTPEQLQAGFQASIDELSKQLVRRCQASGGAVNVLELEIRVAVLTEHVNLLTRVFQQNASGLTDAKIQEQMTAQVFLLAKTLEGQLDQLPRIAVARAMNGSKHN